MSVKPAGYIKLSQTQHGWELAILDINLVPLAKGSVPATMFKTGLVEWYTQICKVYAEPDRLLVTIARPTIPEPPKRERLSRRRRRGLWGELLLGWTYYGFGIWAGNLFMLACSYRPRWRKDKTR